MENLEHLSKRLENNLENVRKVESSDKRVKGYEMVISDYQYIVNELLNKQS